MRAGQGKGRVHRVVPGRRLPACGRVAGLAGGGERRGGVRRIRGGLVVRLVAAGAVARPADPLPAGVARNAGRRQVPAGQREAGDHGVVPGHGPPRRGRRVALLAVRAEADLRVRDAGVGRAGVVAGVAAEADDRGADEVLALLSGMARFAVGGGMHADEREAARGVLFEELAAALPAGRRMAPVAARTELAAVHVLVAVDAGAGDVAERQVAVTVAALHRLVATHEREARPAVVEAGRTRRHGPVAGVVAGRTAQGELAVRAVRGRLRARRHRGGDQQCRDGCRGRPGEVHRDPSFGG